MAFRLELEAYLAFQVEEAFQEHLEVLEVHPYLEAVGAFPYLEELVDRQEDEVGRQAGQEAYPFQEVEVVHPFQVVVVVLQEA